MAMIHNEPAGNVAGAAPAFAGLPGPSRRFNKLDYSKSPALVSGSIMALANVVVMLVGFFTPNWVTMFANLNAYGTKSQQVGLWQFCYSSSSHFTFRDARKKVSLDTTATPASEVLAEWLKTATNVPLSGCRWLGQFDFWYMTDFMQPPFFVVGQILFSLALALTIFIGFSLIKLWCGRYAEREGQLAAILSVTSAISGFCILATLIMFALNVYTGSWLNDWPERAISWSYGVAIAGLVLAFCVSIMFGWLAHQLHARATHFQLKNIDSSVRLLRYDDSLAAGEKV